ncbi:ABC transporter substrate-binding protein [Planotetraspora kaengkrachanensis]|uniref:ABC transporter substrate-binding protein n=1 Tax=Planotetraspora kaengkrachanensis TaxID=575193 RepID=A0A8J3LYC3_9ACTN|nr:ABC transporter substrate-binding protein [Planotetraspora kaengkrachanensis]GIG78995.1 ABC transporter substrate-binding protein [Planotetraspora kaengkrachanensis]
MASHNPTPFLESRLDRRTLLRGIGGGAAALAAAPLLAACSGGPAPTDPAARATSLGSGLSDPVPRSAIQAMVDAFTGKSGATVKTNVMPRAQLVDNISSYLQSNPEDVITWFAGYKMRYYAAKGLLAPVDDVWAQIGGNFSEGLTKASEGEDGKKYFVPNYNYPWGFYYRKSVWQERGYEIPGTFDAFRALCEQMKKDGLIPIAFADKDGWPAMGTFDYINMRTNGYQFHLDLCAHKESWDQQKVKDVFDNWKALLPYQDEAALGATWQEGARTMTGKKAGMYLIGAFIAQDVTDKEILADLDFFPFPAIAVEGTDAIEAPIDGFVLAKRAGSNKTAKDMLAFFGSGAGQDAYAAKDSSNLQTAKDADTASFSELNKKGAAAIAGAKYISQFFDRDALPAMANNVMIPALQGFIKDGTIDTRAIEAQAKSLYAAE